MTTAIKLELYKMVLSIIPAGFFIWTQEMHFAIITFALLITLDTITGAFNKSITGLSPNTSYRVRAYAVNSAGTGYGTTVTVTTSTDFIPRIIWFN